MTEHTTSTNDQGGIRWTSGRSRLRVSSDGKFVYGNIAPQGSNMVLDYTCKRGVTVIDGSGMRDIADLHDTVEEALRDPAASVPLKLVIDLRRSTGTPPGTQGIRRGTSFFKRLGERVDRRRAYIVERQVDFGMVRMASVYAERYGHEIKVFRTLEDAVVWLTEPETGSVGQCGPNSGGR